MPHISKLGRVRRSVNTSTLDAKVLANARATIERSLQILRDSAPETCLGPNYAPFRLRPPARVQAARDGDFLSGFKRAN
jgi:hypothetical protein